MKPRNALPVLWRRWASMSAQKTRKAGCRVPRARLRFVAVKVKVVNRCEQVLLIDDNPLQLKVREAVLRNAGFQVAVATTADSALAMLRTFWPTASVWWSPTMSCRNAVGRTWCAQSAPKNDWLPIIVLSGLPEAEVEYRRSRCRLPGKAFSAGGIDRACALQPRRSHPTPGSGVAALRL